VGYSASKIKAIAKRIAYEKKEQGEEKNQEMAPLHISSTTGRILIASIERDGTKGLLRSETLKYISEDLRE